MSPESEAASFRPRDATCSRSCVGSPRRPAHSSTCRPNIRRAGATALTADKMKKCVWLRTTRVAQIEFLEWTSRDRLRHARFVGLRKDKEPSEVVKEHAGES